MVSKERNERAGSDEFADPDAFEPDFSALLSLAYRMLGSRSEAEDAVQDTFVRWQEADRTVIRNRIAWLTTTCTRRCIDLLRRTERDRETWAGRLA